MVLGFGAERPGARGARTGAARGGVRGGLLEEAGEAARRGRQALDVVLGHGRDAVLDRAGRQAQRARLRRELVVRGPAALGQAEGADAGALLADLGDRLAVDLDLRGLGLALDRDAGV